MSQQNYKLKKDQAAWMMWCITQAPGIKLVSVARYFNIRETTLQAYKSGRLGKKVNPVQPPNEVIMQIIA